MSGYSFETKEYPLEKVHLPFVSATYVIHLKGNGRYDAFVQQLDKYPLTEKVFVLLNEGYKRVNKGPFVTSAALDLIDAYNHIFQDALKKGYTRVLVLEDDFFFQDGSFEGDVKEDVKQFVEEMDSQQKEYMFLMGCIPYCMLPVAHHCYRCYLSTGTHAVLYSKGVMEKLVKDNGTFEDFDVHTNIQYPRYTYSRPICYQLFPDTENKSQWGGSNWLFVMGAMVLKWVFQLLQLEKRVEPGYSLFYLWAKWSILGILVVALWLLPHSLV